MKNIITIALLFGIIYGSLEPEHFEFESILDPFYF